MRGGIRRLLLLDGAPSRRSIERLITESGRLAVAGADLSLAAIVDDCIAAAVDRLIDEHGELPFTEVGFRALQDEVRRKGANRAGSALGSAVAIVAEANRVTRRLAALRAPSVQASVDDANAHLGRLVRPGFVSATGLDRLGDVERYVRGIGHRIDHLAGAGPRDRARLDEVAPLEQRYAALVDRLAPEEITGEIADLRWQLEELRVAVFAQPVGAKGKASAVRIDRALSGLGA
jgi:ATP-dependent helicase HrpA